MEAREAKEKNRRATIIIIVAISAAAVIIAFTYSPTTERSVPALVIEQTEPIGEYPVGVAVNPNSNISYVTNSDDNTLSIIRQAEGQ